MLSALTGQQVYLKLENLQMTGSFKERGALNRIATLTPEQAARGGSGGERRQSCAGSGVSRDEARDSGADRDAAGYSAGEGDRNAWVWR